MTAIEIIEQRRRLIELLAVLTDASAAMDRWSAWLDQHQCEAHPISDGVGGGHPL